MKPNKPEPDMLSGPTILDERGRHLALGYRAERIRADPGGRGEVLSNGRNTPIKEQFHFQVCGRRL